VRACSLGKITRAEPSKAPPLIYTTYAKHLSDGGLQDFFRAYRTRLRVKSQIREFNTLVSKMSQAAHPKVED
jgi:hypothetical protein